MNRHPACLEESELLSQCRIDRLRRSGPGGQHRNKVETGIRIEHLPTGVRVEATERRAQAQNQQQAIQRLRIRLACEVRCDPGATADPTWIRRSAGELAVAEGHPDFPAVIAYALDVLHQQDWRVAAAARQLKCRTTALVRLLRKNTAVWQRVNRQRMECGLRPLQH